ncbi:MAG: L,D-transpeptidase [Verrucomicrobiae bacterium]|nr:L,D-transpeptidase [Verrucomicrobiae bacterium]NNJ43144.1 L,D-transpeptidase [Akkermansiaceae bacterium]
MNITHRAPMIHVPSYGLFWIAAIAAVLCLTSCGQGDPRNGVIISVKDQKMLLVHNGAPVKTYGVSTSKFGLGSRRGSLHTPLGRMEVARKIGSGAPSGAVFKSRRRTGEVIKVNAPGRDPIVSRIIWLRGKQSRNRNTYARYIYIHGTPEERNIGHPASYGCIRMKSRDIIDLYRQLAIGSGVNIIRRSLMHTNAGRDYAARNESYLPAAGN